MLNDVRTNGAWNEWIKFFLGIVDRQCVKYEGNVLKIEELYETGLSNTTVNRMLDKLTAHNVVFADERKRGNLYYFYDLIELL